MVVSNQCARRNFSIDVTAAASLLFSGNFKASRFMNKPITIDSHAKFSISYTIDKLRPLIEPFIKEVTRHLEREATLEDSVLIAAALFPDAARCFVIQPGHMDETFGLREKYLFSERTPAELVVETNTTRCQFDLTSAGAVKAVQEVLVTCASGRHSLKSATSVLSEDGQDFLSQLLETEALMFREREVTGFAPSKMSGIHRLQHASLLFRTAASGILVDPHLHSGYRPDEINTDIHSDQLTGKVDAILISHFHEDHFYLSTLLMFPLDTPIVVPKVPRSSIICGDMERILKAAGFRNVFAVDWYSEPLRFGDIQVHVLPFFGEQPLLFEKTRQADLRNWGNTYVVQTADYTSWFLIDSGDDARGLMADVAHYVREKIGPIDVLLSNLKRFCLRTPLYINGGLNWLTLTTQQMTNFGSMEDHCITLGPEGVADVCRIVNARYYLPYAHWWGEVGGVVDSSVDVQGEEERQLLTELHDRLRDAGAKTEIVPWRVGDGFVARTRLGLTHLPINCN